MTRPAKAHKHGDHDLDSSRRERGRLCLDPSCFDHRAPSPWFTERTREFCCLTEKKLISIPEHASSKENEAYTGIHLGPAVRRRPVRRTGLRELHGPACRGRAAGQPRRTRSTLRSCLRWAHRGGSDGFVRLPGAVTDRKAPQYHKNPRHPANTSTFWPASWPRVSLLPASWPRVS